MGKRNDIAGQQKDQKTRVSADSGQDKLTQTQTPSVPAGSCSLWLKFNKVFWLIWGI